MSLGVYPYLFFAKGSAFVLFNKYYKHFKLPYSDAQCKAFDWSKSLWFGSEPDSISICKISTWSISAAICKGYFFNYED